MKKQQIYLLLALSLFLNFRLCISVQAQQNFQSYYKEGLYQFDDDLKIKKSQIFTTYLSSFGFTQANQMSRTAQGEVDDEGTVSERYVQKYLGYKVEGTMMNVISKYGIVLSVNGFSLPYLNNVNVQNNISEADALTAALNYIGADKYAWEDQDLELDIKTRITYQNDTTSGDTTYDLSRTYYPKGELVISLPYRDTNIYDTSKYALCWKFAINPLYYESYTVDTNSVDTIAHYDTVTGYRRHNEVIVYVNALTGTIHGYDPNVEYWTGHLNPTCYDGNQDIDIKYGGSLWWLSGPKFTFRDIGRNIYLKSVTSYGTLSPVGNTITDNGSGTWGEDSWKSAYWQIQKTSDYFRYHHGFWGVQQPPAAYAIPQIVWKNYDPGTYRTRYYYNSTTGEDNYYIGDDVSGSSLPHSAAYLDVLAHEYTHALIKHGPDFNTGQANAIKEGLCDFFGTWVAYSSVPSVYTSDWTNGFGWQTNQYARKFQDPTTDAPGPSSGAYGDAYFAGTDDTRRGGVLRHQMVLHDWGGTYNGISVTAQPPTERDYFVTMMWWSWSNMNYVEFRNAMLGWYKMKYGECSPKWISCVRSWAAVNVGTIPSCARTWLENLHVHTTVKSSTLNGNSDINVVTSPRPASGHVGVHTVDELDQQNVAYYTWDIPQQWYTTWVNPQVQSAFYIDSVSGFDTTRQFRCIVTFADSTKDTLSGYVHFVDENYETIQQKDAGSNPIKDINSIASGNISVFPNPARAEITVELPFAPRRYLVARLYDMMGREVFKKELISQNSILHLPELATGTYILKVKGDGTEFVSRVAIKR